MDTNKMISIKLQIAEEFKKVPVHLKDNFLVRATINSIEELGPEGVLDQLRDINKYMVRKAPAKTLANPADNLAAMKDHVRAGKKQENALGRNRKAR